MSSIPPNVRITEATAADISAISVFFHEMWRQAGPDSPGFAGATESVIAEIAEPEAIRPRLGGPERRMFLAYERESVVGFAATRAIDTATIELAGIVVLQSKLGRGIGALLVEKAVQSARQHRFDRMAVSTEVANDTALGFYQAHGFEFVGESTATVEGTAVAVSNLERTL